MNADRVAGSGPGGLPLPPASTTRNVSLRGTLEVMPLPPFHGTPPGLNGHSPDPAEAIAASQPEATAAPAYEAPAAMETPVVSPRAAAPEPAIETPGPTTDEVFPALAPGDGAAAPPFEPEPDLSGWFSNGLGNVSLAAEGAEIDVSDAEPVFATDSSVPAEVVFGSGFPAEAPAGGTEAETPWQVENEGVAEPVFEEDVHATEEMLAEKAAGDFPLDAFIIPEDAQRLPTGVADQQPTDANGSGAAVEIAARFEHVSRLLREEDVNELLRKLARGDKLDALLAGLLAGYLATHDA